MRLRITVEQKTTQKSDQAEVIVDKLKTSSVRIVLILVLFVSSLQWNFHHFDVWMCTASFILICFSVIMNMVPSFCIRITIAQFMASDHIQLYSVHQTTHSFRIHHAKLLFDLLLFHGFGFAFAFAFSCVDCRLESLLYDCVALCLRFIFHTFEDWIVVWSWNS